MHNIDQINNKVKLVIWDLDETFWKGVLSEGDIILIEENIKLVIELTDRGIMNSICSKNNFKQVKELLKKYNLWDYFIFPKIDWTPKGEMVKQIIENAQLRAPNVLFIDDNHMNLEEVKYYNPGIMTLHATNILNIFSNKYLEGKDDFNHQRLKQYKILEKKEKDKKEYFSNKEFLQKCNIRVNVIDHCLPYLDRITELINRANQLNFTKNRMSSEEIEKIVTDNLIESACVEVTDNYGDYGIVGFYALKDKKLVHFVFSCRILNLGIEQYIYSKLGFPEIDVKGKVSVKLDKNKIPDWIEEIKNSNIIKKASFKSNKKISCLIRGGCDLAQIKHYLVYKDLKIDTEFNYASKSGVNIHREHSEILRSNYLLDKKQKSLLINKLPFYDENIFNTKIFDDIYDVIIYSVLMDYTHGIYRYKKDKDIFIAYGDFKLPLTEKSNWNIVLKNNISKDINKKFLEWFNNEFVFEGFLSKERFLENLFWIRKKIPKNTLLIILNGSEIELEHEWENKRYLHHKEMNKVLNKFIKSTNNTYLIDINKYVKDKKDITNNIRHYNRKIYKDIAFEIVEILQKKFNISKEIDKKVVAKNRAKKLFGNLKSYIKYILKKEGSKIIKRPS